MHIKPADFYSYLSTLPIGAVHVAIYSSGTYIRQLTDNLPNQLKFSSLPKHQYTGALYSIDRKKKCVSCPAIEIYHLGNSLEEAIHNYPHLFV